MIIQTGMRTDIPAFYSEWFINRIKEGYVLVRNPYNPVQVTRYSLSPDVVDLISFCTKNPAPMLGKMEYLDPYGQYWFVTITPYGKDIEPNVPDKLKVMESFKILSDRVGADSIGWRYDPILVDSVHTVEWHIQKFEEMAKTLCSYTGTCVISFIDIYKKVVKNFPEAGAVSSKDKLAIGKAFIETASRYGMTIKPCAVGAYDTCGHLCRYCYANTDPDLVRENMRKHDPKSPFLLGDLNPEDVIHDADQKSWIDRQMRLDIF